MKRSLLCLVVVSCALCQVLAAQPPAPIAQTGQTECYDKDWNQAACSGTGQDGDLRMGIARPTPRFTDNGNGTVTDNLTGLIWMQLLNCVSETDWGQALVIANNLQSGLCGLSDGSSKGDWRIPNIRELFSLLHFGTSFPSLDPDIPVVGIQPDWYWSSTSAIDNPENAWSCSFGRNDGAFRTNKSSELFLWPVRGEGSIDAPSPVAQTGQSTCWDEAGDFVDCGGTGQDGDLQLGAEWPDPRFTDNGDGTVTDELTGLVWLQDGDCFGNDNLWLDSLSPANILADGSCGLSDGSLEGEWRLPNAKELESLVNYNVYEPALPYPNPFLGVDLPRAFWSSTTQVDQHTYAFHLQSRYGLSISLVKVNRHSIWPVRGGMSQIFLDGFESGDTSAWSSTVQ